MSECVTFSDFRGVDNEIIGEKQNSQRASERQEGFLCNKHGVLFSQSNAVHNPSVNQTNNSLSVLMKPRNEKTKQNQRMGYDILKCNISKAVLFPADNFIVNIPEITEGRTIRHLSSRPFQ